jgi:hypothetical protein
MIFSREDTMLRTAERRPVEAAFYIRSEDFGLEKFRRAEDAADVVAHYMRFLGTERIEFGANGEGRVRFEREEQLKQEIGKRLEP